MASGAGQSYVQVQGTDALPEPRGLSSQEVQSRRRRGEGNAAVSASSRSYARILHTNVFSFYNSILCAPAPRSSSTGRCSTAGASRWTSRC